MIKVLYKSRTSSASVELPPEMKLTKNFTLKELANNQGSPANPQYIISEYSVLFNSLFQIFRDRYGLPIDPTSGYRQPEYNKKVGGNSNSLHLQACAVDFIDKYKRTDFYMLSLWLGVLIDNNIIGAVNIYSNGDYYRYHVEAFSDTFLGYKKRRIRVYTNKDHYKRISDYYKPLSIEVTYNG